MRRPIALPLALLLAVLGPAIARADTVSREFLLRYNEVAQRAERALARGGAAAAIQVYEEALLSEDLTGYGRIHLRLGKLYREQDRNPEAAAHFRACRADERVDAIDRDIICLPGFDAVTAPLEITGLPEHGEVIVIEPRLFAGPHHSGKRLPKGTLKVMVEAPGREPRESVVVLDGPASWAAVLGLSRRAGPLVPDAFVSDTPSDGDEDPFAAERAFEEATGPSRWPAYTAAGVGLALVAGGVTLGYLNRGELDDIRSRQTSGGCKTYCGPDLAEAENRARLSDGLWIGGAVVAASSVALWFLLDGPDLAEVQ